MEIQHSQAPLPWYAKYEKLVQWATLVFIVAGGLLHFFLVDKPTVNSVEAAEKLTQNLIAESKKNQVLLEQRLREAKSNTEALDASLKQITAQVELARATVDQINDPTKRESERLTLDKQQAEKIREIDELIESLRPNMQVSLDPKATWKPHYISFHFTIKNATARAIVVNEPTISVTINPNPDSVSAQTLPPQPRSDEITITTCKAGLINPGDAFPCAATVQSTVPVGGVHSLSYSARFKARTDIPKESQTWKMLVAQYPASYIEPKLKTSLTMNGYIFQ